MSTTRTVAGTALAHVNLATHTTLAIQDRAPLTRLHTSSEANLADFLDSTNSVRVMHGCFRAA